MMFRRRPGPVRLGAPPRARFWRRHRIITALLMAVLLLVVIAAPSVVSALTRPGTDTVAERLTEWARTHGMSSMVDLAERVQYDLNPPKTGGTPVGGVPTERGASTTRLPQSPAAAAATALHVPPRIPAFASTPLAHEGAWRVVDTAGGEPSVATAFLRPDAVHTSYLSGFVWMNPKLVRFSLHPGLDDPGAGSWGRPNMLPASARRGLLGAFNSGFRLYAARGGYYSYGHTAVQLRPGAASFVIDRNGSATVGVWGRDVHMTPHVAAVRQNLALIVDHGRAVSGLQQNIEQKWGATIGNAYYVWRSGIGVRPDGSLVYVAGPALSVESLARLLARAGCVRAMELDINPEWTQFVLYSGHGHVNNPTARDLLPDMQQPADRYFSPSSRDFFVVQARQAAA